MATTLKTIVPHLLYDKQAREAAEFYVSIFPDSKINHSTLLKDTPSGDAETISFELSGQPFMAISAGPFFTFNESVSFIVYCDSQEEIDYYWNSFTKEGEEGQCGWLKDKFGLSWQIVPSLMNEMMERGTQQQIASVTQAFLKMKKFDIAALQQAFDKE